MASTWCESDAARPFIYQAEDVRQSRVIFGFFLETKKRFASFLLAAISGPGALWGLGGDGRRSLLVPILLIGGLRWSRLSEQIFRVDKWSLCRG